MASIYDTFKESQCAKVLSRLGMIIALSSGLAPVLGGNIAAGYGWQIIFIVVSIATFIIWILLFLSFPETNHQIERKTSSFISFSRSYKELLLNSCFLSYASIEIIKIFWLWAELGNLPMIFISHYNIPVASYGYFMTFGVFIPC